MYLKSTLFVPGGIFVLQTDNPRYWRFIETTVPVLFDWRRHEQPWPDAPAGRTCELDRHLDHRDVGVGGRAVEDRHVAETSSNMSAHRSGEHAERAKALSVGMPPVQRDEPMATLTGREMVEEHQQPASIGYRTENLFVEEDLQVQIVAEHTALLIAPQLAHMPDLSHAHAEYDTTRT